MKQIVFIILFLGVFINTFSQNMWKYKYLDVYSPTSTRYTVDSAKQIILSNEICKKNYRDAVEYLYYWHRDTEKQFLLENLDTKINPSFRGVENSCQWRHFYWDTYYRGLLGDTTAISRMDSIVMFGTEFVKEFAVYDLAEIGRFDYYDYVKQLYISNRDSYDGLLTMYGEDPRFKAEVLSLLEEQARNYDLNDEFQRANMLGLITTYILKLDRQKAIEILDEYFRNTVDSLRWQFYEDLKYIDKEGQTERTKYFLLNSQNDRYLGTYLPRFMYITQYKIYSTKFLSLKFIKFLKEYGANPETSRYRAIKKYLLYFKPAKPDSALELTSMLDTLTSYTNQSYGYDWLKDEAYKDELLNKIETAKNYLSSADSVNCAIEMKKFQNSVAQVYADSAGSYPKYVSNEGYKFLYYYAGYILDRLPEPAEGLPVKLEDSQGSLLQGGSLQYYDSGWKDATDNGDGTFTVQTERTTISLKMHYAGAARQMNNVTVSGDTAVFQTVKATVKLIDSYGTPVDTGTVKYYASGWKDLGVTVNGVATKELLPKQYTFKMEYGGAGENKQQDVSEDSPVIFQTEKPSLQIKN